QQDREYCYQDGNGRAGRIQPCDAGCGQDQTKAGSEKNTTHAWQETEQADRMAPLRHIRYQPALKVSVSESRYLLEKSKTETGLEVPSYVEQARRDWEFQKKERNDE